MTHDPAKAAAIEDSIETLCRTAGLGRNAAVAMLTVTAGVLFAASQTSGGDSARMEEAFLKTMMAVFTLVKAQPSEEQWKVALVKALDALNRN